MDCSTTVEPGRTLTSGDGHHARQPRPERTPEQEQTGVQPELVEVETERTEEEPGAQMDSWWTQEGVNTDEDWEVQLMAMWEHGTQLAEQHAGLLKEKEKEEAEFQKHVQELEKRKEEKIRQHQALLEKLESVRVKMQLNDSKTTRRKFLAKKEEMRAEKDGAEESKNRLTKELEEGERKVALLLKEKAQEQQTWGKELDDLRVVLQRVQKEAEAAERQALQDEMAALEKQRDVTMAQVDTWLKAVEQYLSFLRMDPTQQHRKQMWEWEKQESLVQKKKDELQQHFQEVLDLFQQGHEVQSLPKIQAPVLPPVPVVDLYFNQIMLSLRQPGFPLPAPLPKVSNPLLPQHQPQTLLRAPLRSTPPPTPSPPVTVCHAEPTTPSLSSVLPSGPSHHPTTATAPTQPPIPTQPTVPASTGKLDKLLDKLGAKFPQCTRTKLMVVLQQIKSSRGTMAGLSMEEVTEQVGLRLAQSDLLPPGPISYPTPSSVAPQAFHGPHAPFHPAHGSIQRTPRPLQRAPTPQVLSRKLCLMCQNHVQPDSQYPLMCSHIIHRECISVWLRTSRNNPCPFCPSK